MSIHPQLPNFTWREVACRATGLVRPHRLFWSHMRDLQALRDWWGAPITITSGWRTPAHNAYVGGHPNSNHLLILDDSSDTRFATDLRPALSSPHLRGATARGQQALYIAIDLLAEAARRYFGGIGKYDDFLHLDKLDADQWDYRTISA